MSRTAPLDAITDFLGSAQIFSSAVREVLQLRLNSTTDPTLTLAQVEILQLVSHAEACSLGDVADFLGVSAAAASKSVDRLVRRGLIERRAAPHDRRALRLTVSSAGRSILRSLLRVRDRELREMFRSVDRESLRSAADVLDRLSVSLVEGECPPHACFRCGVFFRDRCRLRETPERDCTRHRHVQSPNHVVKLERKADPKDVDAPLGTREG